MRSAEGKKSNSLHLNFFLIHSADHGSDHYFHNTDCPYVCTSFTKLQNRAKITAQPGLWDGRVDH